jgi:acyl dehydratase
VVFERPLFPGDSLYAESEVLEKRESESKPDRGIVAIETRGYNQNRERIIVLRRRFLAPKRGSE